MRNDITNGRYHVPMIVGVLALLFVLFSGAWTLLSKSRLDQQQAYLEHLLRLSSLSLATPLWNLDYDAIRTFLDAVMRDPKVAHIDVKSPPDLHLSQSSSPWLASGLQQSDTDPRYIVEKRNIVYHEKIIGQVTIVLSNEGLTPFILSQMLGSLMLMLMLFAGVAGMTFYTSKATQRTKKLTASIDEINAEKEAAEIANRDKNQLLVNLSHELCAPLNVIMSCAESLLEDAKLIGLKDAPKDLLRVATASTHMMCMINELQNLSNIEAGKVEFYVERIQVDALLRDVITTIRPIAESNGNEFTVQTSKEIDYILMDVSKLRQCLYSLLSNACKFTKNGSVSLSVTLSSLQGSRMLRFVVSDTGIGIAPEHMANLFIAFSQGDSSSARRYGGMGLGLAMTRMVCKAMGGSISVTSELGKGTKFEMSIPEHLEGKGYLKAGQYWTPDNLGHEPALVDPPETEKASISVL